MMAMRFSVKVSLVAGAAATLVFGAAGCATRQPSTSRGASPGSQASSTSEGTSGRTPSGSALAGTAGTVGGVAPSGPVPARFAATSVTFVSADEAFVLGTAPCVIAPCTSIVRTFDRGASWRGLPAPKERVGQVGSGSVWGIRFATPEHGFVFGDGLWETIDGGEHWIRANKANKPDGSILALATVDRQVLALAVQCTATSSCSQNGLLWHRPLSGGSWTILGKASAANLLDPTDLIATHAGDAAVLDGTSVVMTYNGGVGITANPAPCTTLGVSRATSVAVTSPEGLALLCIGQGFMGHTIKQVYVSADGGAHWTKAGAPSPVGDGGTLAAATPSRLAIATASAASWLFYSGNAGATWKIALTDGDGGMGWADLGFTTSAYGVVVHGTAIDDGNTSDRPGQLLLTENAGATWHVVRF